MAKPKQQDLLEAIREQLDQRQTSPTNHSTAVTEILAYLSYLAWHFRKYAAVPSFLDAIRSDIVATLYAFTAGLERSTYLHARSLLENLLRHCHYDAHPTAFVIRHLQEEEEINERWKDFIEKVPTLPHFIAIEKETRERLFERVKKTYSECSRFVHGSTFRYRSNYEGIGSINMDKAQTDALGELLMSVAEVGLTLLALVHIGPYMLISQPIRRYMLGSAMRSDARKLFLQCMREIPFSWATHQRTAALQVLRIRKQAPSLSPEGLLRDEEEQVFLIRPRRS